MSGLKKLALCYLTAASAFALAAGLAAHPDIERRGKALTDLLALNVWHPVRDYAWRADIALLNAPDLLSGQVQSDARVRIALAPPGLDDGRDFAHFDPPPMPKVRIIDSPRFDPSFHPVDPIIIAPDLAQVAPSQSHVETPRVAQKSVLSATSALVLTPEEENAREHLAASVTPEMRSGFNLFIFVSKADKGPLAQRMYVFRKVQGDLKLVYDWAASTGREKREFDPRGRATFTTTPSGLYQLDPDRMYVRYRSMTWDQSMPYAMFFNWQREGLQTGLAIHAASGADIARLGERASAGCVHLSPQNARTLFNLIQDEYRGVVPRFAVDDNDTMSNKGRFAHNPDGSLKTAAGFKVLIDIEDYGGQSGDKVAALF
jgi:hypothetical protein